MKKISIIVPCYNEEKTIPYFYEEMMKVIPRIKKAKVEVLFINDGSSDQTLSCLRKLSEENKNIHYLSFSRNFGKEAAMMAGLEHVDGDYVAIMDVDLQDPPSLLPQMYAFLEQNPDYDCMATRSVSRHGYSPIRKFFTKWFYKIINRISKTEMVDGARDFRFMSRPMVDAILSMREYNRYSKGIFSFVGFQTKWITFENQERVSGQSTFNFWKLFTYAIEAITAFSNVPLAIASIAGIVFCLIAFFLILFIIVRTLIFGDPTSGWPSLACIIFLVSGVQLFCLGIIGQYLSKTYLETKRRPIYIIKETDQKEKKTKK